MPVSVSSSGISSHPGPLNPLNEALAYSNVHNDNTQAHLLKQNRHDDDFIPTAFAEEDLRSRFETTNEFYSHVIKDPFYHYFLISQILSGSKLIKLDPDNSSVWFSCILEASNALQGSEASELNSANFNDGVLPSATKLIDDITSALPTQARMRSLISYFYTNVHCPYPILDVPSFENQFTFIIEQNQYYYDIATTLQFLAELSIVLRLGYLSLYSYYNKFEPNNPILEWTLESPINEDFLINASFCIRLLLNMERLNVRTLILLRLMLLLDEEDKYVLTGWTDTKICELINDMGHDIKDKDPNLWLAVCWNNLHYMLLCGAVHNHFNDSIFINDDHLLNDSQTLEEIISLDDKGKLSLEIMHILKMGYQLFKLIISNRNLEHRLNDQEFLQFKIQENNRLSLFEKTRPTYEFLVGTDREVELLPGVKINISMFTQFNQFKWKYFFKIKKLANLSLLMYHFEKDRSPLFWNHLYFTLEAVVDISKNIGSALANLRLLKTPSRFVVSHVICYITNRTVIVIFGLVVRLFYFRLNSRDPEVTPLVREILLKLFSILKDLINCADINVYQPRTIAMASNMIQLFNLGKLEFSITSYLNSSKEEIEQYHKRTARDTRWSKHLNLSPPSNLKHYGVMIMKMEKTHAREILNILTLYDK